MDKHYSLKVAEAIYLMVEQELTNRCVVKSNVEDGIVVSAWSNCREQGYHLRVMGNIPDLCINFAQQRNSNNILVIVGTNSDFDSQTNQPSDELWERAGATKYFQFYEREKAAIFIADLVEKAVKK